MPPVSHGGDLDPGRRKVRRPLSSRKPVHLMLKAKQPWKNGRSVMHETRRLTERFKIRVLDLALASDHVHLAIQIPCRRDYVSFIRALTGILARKFGKGLWKALPFTRVAEWGRAYRELQKYFERNRLEFMGWIPYEARRDWYRKRRRRA